MYINVKFQNRPTLLFNSFQSIQPSNAVPHYPTSGAELLEDLHRRLQAQSIHGGTRLPARPRVYRHKHRARSRARSLNTVNAITYSSSHKVYSSQPLVSASSRAAPLPDLLPTSAWNNPSRHTQYQLIPEQPQSPSYTQHNPVYTQPNLIKPSAATQSLPTSDYSTSPSMSESPPLVLGPPSPPLAPPPLPPPPSSTAIVTSASNLPLDIPSPPLQRNSRRRQDPLTSTMLACSPPPPTRQGSSASSSAGQASGHTTHPTSPVSPPEVSSIPPTSLDETTYQNIAQEIYLDI